MALHTPLDGASHPGRWRFTSRLCHHQPLRRRLIARQPKIHSPSTAAHTPSTPAHTPSMPAHTPSMPAHSPSTAAHSPPIPDHTPSMAAHSPFMTAHSPSDVGLVAPASPLHIPMHTDATIAPSTENPRSIDGKSTLHRRRLSPGQRHFYTRPNASPRLAYTSLSSPSSSPQFPSFLFLSHFVPSISHSLLAINNHIPPPYSLTHHLVQ